MKACIVEEILKEEGIKFTKRNCGDFTKFVIQYAYVSNVVTSELLYVKNNVDSDRILYEFICRGEDVIYDVIDCDKVMNTVIANHNLWLDMQRG